MRCDPGALQGCGSGQHVAVAGVDTRTDGADRPVSVNQLGGIPKFGLPQRLSQGSRFFVQVLAGKHDG